MMSVGAARKALDHAGIDPGQIDCVIVATVTHLLQTPAIATAIAYELGTDQAAAFDISAACAGFCHGLALADQMVRGGGARYALVIGVERLSDLTDMTDRGTAFIFADGAGAAIIGPSDDPGHRPGGVGLRRRAVRPDPAEGGLARHHRDGPAGAPLPDHAGQPRLPLGVVHDGQGRAAGARQGRHLPRRPRRVRAAPGEHAHHRRDGSRHEAPRAGHHCPRHRRAGQHVGCLDPPGPRSDDRGGRGQERRHSRC